MKRAWLFLLVVGCGGAGMNAGDSAMSAALAADDCRAACATLAACGADATACTTDCTSAAPSLRAAEGHVYLTAIATADNCVQARKQAGAGLATRAALDEFYGACRAKVAACTSAMVPDGLCAFDDDRPLPVVRDAVVGTLGACFDQGCSTAISACLRQRATDAHLLLPAFPVLIKVIWPDRP